MTDHFESQIAEQSGFARFVRLALAVVLALFSIGVLVGFLKASSDHSGASWKGIAVIAALVPGLLCAAWRLYRRGSEDDWLPRTPKRRANRLVLFATIALGGVAGLLMQIGEQQMHPGAGRFRPYDAPLDPTVAAILLVCMPVLAWLYYRWHQSADEHDLAAYKFGGMLSLYTFFFASVGWWIAWRGRFTSEPDGFAIFWAVAIVWTAGWMWKRFR